MVTLNNTECCGVDEISGVYTSTPIEVLKYVCREKYTGLDEEDCGCEDGCDDCHYGDIQAQAYLTFTDAIYNSNGGKRLAQYIKDNKLGTLVSPRERKNPNTGNTIKIWVWSPNERNLKAWYVKNCG